MAGEGSKEYIPEVLDEPCPIGVVPRPYGSFGEIDLLVGITTVDLVQCGDAASVVVPCRSGNILRGFRVFEYVQWIICLGGDVVVIVVMVKEQDPRLQSGFPECRAYSLLYEIALVLPGHVQRHRVAPVQRFILQGHSVDRVATLFHGLDPFHEVDGIVLVMVRIKATSCPAVVVLFPVFRHLHPFRAAPRGCYYPDFRIDLEYLVQDGEEVTLVQGMDGEIVYPFPVAPGIFIHRKIRTSDADPYQGGSYSFFPAEHFLEEGGSFFGAHLEEIEASGMGDRHSETVHALEGFAAETDLVGVDIFGLSEPDLAFFHHLASGRGRVGFCIGCFAGVFGSGGGIVSLSASLA